MKYPLIIDSRSQPPMERGDKKDRTRSKASDRGSSVDGGRKATADDKHHYSSSNHNHYHMMSRTKTRTKASTRGTATATITKAKHFRATANGSKTLKSTTSESSVSTSRFGRLQASLASNLSEMRRLYTNWRRGGGGGSDVIKNRAMHDWALWRTKVNESLINGCGSNDENDGTSRLEPHVASFLSYVGVYGDKEPSAALDPESYMFFGLPRIKVDPGEQLDSEFRPNQMTRSIPNKLTIDEADTFQPMKGLYIIGSAKFTINISA